MTLSSAFLLLGCWASISVGPAATAQEKPGLEALLDQISQRMSAAPALTDWSARVHSDSRRMDKKWRPQKITIIEKTITVRDGVMGENIHLATEEKKGKVKDITKKMVAEAAIARAKARRKAEEKGSEEEGRDHSRRFTLSLDEAIPFGPEKRDLYAFELGPDTDLDGRSVWSVEVRADSPSDRRMEGTFWIDPDTFDIVGADLRPSKKRSVLKRFEMTLRFGRLDSGHLVLRETRIRLHVGLVIKNIRVDAHEVYSDYRILNDSP